MSALGDPFSSLYLGTGGVVGGTEMGPVLLVCFPFLSAIFSLQRLRFSVCLVSGWWERSSRCGSAARCALCGTNEASHDPIPRHVCTVSIPLCWATSALVSSVQFSCVSGARYALPLVLTSPGAWAMYFWDCFVPRMQFEFCSRTRNISSRGFKPTTRDLTATQPRYFSTTNQPFVLRSPRIAAWLGRTLLLRDGPW